ncbi:MAG: 50S ribosomal protein L18 [Gammaproteobacteria bacterium]|nr:MAG: 50S ribosomal protein L18 [Gammaproteobacteria bacterium]
MDKKRARLRRSRKTRARIAKLKAVRLCVHRTPRHIYAQIIGPDARVLAAVSTLSKELRGQLGYTGNVEAARAVGRAIAEKARAAGIEKVAFDRSGFLYHGRVKALAEGAREGGLKF